MAPETSPTWERVVGVLGGLLIVGLAVLVLTGDASRPVVEAQVGDVSTAGAAYVVTVEVRNAGGETVEMVTVRGELRGDDGAVVEESEATVSFLPGGGSETVGLLFEQDPDEHELLVRPLGWTDS